MAAQGPTIADAVLSTLQGATFSYPVECYRSYVPRAELDTFSDYAITVVYAGQRCTPDSRAAWRHEYDIDVAVQRRLDVEDNRALDKCETLLDEVVDLFKASRVSGTEARMVAMEINPYVPEHLNNFKQFTGVVRLTFRLTRANS